ncbi:MAG: GNAT family N-acetyltransferase [Comamonas sp.]|nr:GNAT family N-acetyltransferase [Comamonas sp.]
MRIATPPTSALPGIALRQLESSDAEAWYAYLQLPKVVEHTSWNLDAVHDLMPIFDALESDALDSQIRFAIVDEPNRQLIGTIGLHTISAGNRTAEIAYDIAPQYWGRGIATSMCRVVTDWSFREMNLYRVQATVLPSNMASTKVLQTCGYQYEGLLRSYRVVRGVSRDYAMFSRRAESQ